MHNVLTATTISPCHYRTLTLSTYLHVDFVQDSSYLCSSAQNTPTLYLLHSHFSLSDFTTQILFHVSVSSPLSNTTERFLIHKLNFSRPLYKNQAPTIASLFSLFEERLSLTQNIQLTVYSLVYIPLTPPSYSPWATHQKEGQMACDKKHMTLYTAELKDFRTMCLNILATHESTILETLWTEADGPGKEPTTDTEKAQLRLVTKVSFTKGKPDFPPPFTRLSDELVYLATKHLKAIDRGRNYPYDFHLRGDIHEDRVPSGISPIVWAHGLPFFPVYKGYYVLCGRAHADWVGWLLRARSHKIMIVHPVWTIGPVVAPGSAVALGRTVERQMVLHVSGSAKDVDRRWEKAQTARDIVSRAHTCGSVVPKSPTGGFIIAPIYQIQGYHVRCGPNDTALGRSVEIGRRTLMDRGVRDFDYDASLKRPYENEGDPAAFMEDDEDNDEDSNKNSSELGDWDKDDELFVMESEQSAETGEIVEEPPRRKAKDALSVIATSVGKKNSEAYIETPAVCTGNFNAKIALQRLKDITATISMKRPAETSDAPSTKVCRIKTTALGITAVKEIASAGSFISNEDIKAET